MKLFQRNSVLRTLGLRLATLLALSLPAESLGQSLENYSPVIHTVGVPYVPLSVNGTGIVEWRTLNWDENRTFPLPIGFPFVYNGKTYTTYSVSSNGTLDFSSVDDAPGVYSDYNPRFTEPGGALLALAPLYDDLEAPLDLPLSQVVRTDLLGAAGSRVRVVEWAGMSTNQAGATLATFQVQLHEATGIIGFHYGAISEANRSYTTGINAAEMSDPPLPSQLLTQQFPNSETFSHVPSNNLVASPAANSLLTFTPPSIVPATPTQLEIHDVLQDGMTLDWVDASTDEVSFTLLMSAPGVGETVAANLTSTTPATVGAPYSVTLSNLEPGTHYSFRITANSEGRASVALEGEQNTKAAGAIVSQQSGFWSDPQIWPNNQYPSVLDDVVIADGHTVVLDMNPRCNSLSVGQGTSGVLEFDAFENRTLDVVGNVVVSAGGTFRTASTGNRTGHLLLVRGDLINEGAIDFSTNNDTVGATIQFNGASDNLFAGSGPVTDLRALTINKGTSRTPILEVDVEHLSVRGATTQTVPGSYLRLLNGTLKISGTFPMAHSTFLTTQPQIPASCGFWLNNPNYTVSNAPEMDVRGLFRLSNGLFQSNALIFRIESGSESIVEGGTLTLPTGAVTSFGPTVYKQSGGSVVAQIVLSSPQNHVELTGGTITVPRSAGPVDYAVDAATGSFQGGTLVLGNGSTPLGTTFSVIGRMPNTIVDNTVHPKTVAIDGTFPSTHVYDLTVLAGSSFKLNGQLCKVLGTRVTNHGTIDATAPGSQLHFSGSTDLPLGKTNMAVPENRVLAGQIFEGTGVIASPLRRLVIDNPNGVSIASTLQVPVVRVDLIRGTLANSGQVSFVGSQVAATTQIGGGSFLGGSFDAPPQFLLGAGSTYSLFYQGENSSRTTGFEVPPTRTVDVLTILNPFGVTLAGGPMTVVSDVFLLGGKLTTSSANILHLATTVHVPLLASAASFVNGPLSFDIAAASPVDRLFPIGKGNAYRPLELRSVETAGITQTFVAEVFNTPPSGVPVAPLGSLDPARYWTLSNTASLNASARVRLTYGADDGVVVPGDARIATSPAPSAPFTSRGGTVLASTIESTDPLLPGQDVLTLGFVGTATSVIDQVLGPGRTLGVFPNPSTPGQTEVAFRAPRGEEVQVSIYDVRGAQVKTLAQETMTGDFARVTWDGRDNSGVTVAAGTYFVRKVLQSGKTETMRFVLLRR